MPDRQALSDAALLAAAAGGDEAAFTRFVERHQAAALRYLRLLGDDDPAALEDALQEAFLAAWRGAAGFRGDGPARSWLLAIARHTLYRQHRRRAGEPAEVVPLETLGHEAGWGEPTSPDPVATLADRAAVRRALAALAPTDREILLLRDVEGLTGEECCTLLEITLPAVKSRLHRARLRFAARLRGTNHGR